jgi:3-oxoacyl-[acyl-carrier-protein] synthase-1
MREGAQRAMRMALDDAALRPAEVDYVNAHATSTVDGDATEAQAIVGLLGRDVPVSSTKSLTGHECWMAGASELVYSILMAQGGFIAPNLNYCEADPRCDGLNVVGQTTAKRLRTVLSNSFGFGGTCAAVVLDFAD